MPKLINNEQLYKQATNWRREIHANPELLYDVEQTVAKVEELLKSFGVDEVVTGVGKTGLVGIINGRHTDSNKVIGLRADMDALPMAEHSGKEWSSRVEGKMHACGHDGHTAILLGTAKYLCDSRDFNGKVALIFQPAEEGGAGGDAMVKDGMMDRFDIDEVYGLHNYPGLPIGAFATREGALMASADFIDIKIKGKGGHAAKPHSCVDPIIAGTAVVQAIQSLVSRNVDPVDSIVVSITKFDSGTTYNVIPQDAILAGTVRTLTLETQAYAEKRLDEIVTQVASAHGCTGELIYTRLYPPTINHKEQTQFAGEVAKSIVGDINVNMSAPPSMGGEDFSFMLQARPGAFICLGNGDTQGLHHPAYDFNDDAIPYGVSYFVGLVETFMPVHDG